MDGVGVERGWLEVPAWPERGICTASVHTRTKYTSGCAEATLMENGEWFLNRVIVPRQERGQGIGSQLLVRLKALLIKSGCRRLIVTPGGYDSDPEAQKRFYLHNDFCVVQTAEDGGVLMAWAPDQPT